MNNKIELNNTQLREYIQLLESTGASRDYLSAFFNETYGVDVNIFNQQYNLCNRIEIDNMNRKLESEQENNIDVDEVFIDELELNLENKQEVWDD